MDNQQFNIIENFICNEINLSTFSSWFWTFFKIRPLLFIPPSCLLDFRNNSNTSFIRDIRNIRVSALTTFIFFTCLMCIYLLLVSSFLCNLRISPLKHMPYFLLVLPVYFLWHFYLLYISLSVAFFVFQKRKTNLLKI